MLNLLFSSRYRCSITSIISTIRPGKYIDNKHKSDFAFGTQTNQRFDYRQGLYRWISSDIWHCRTNSRLASRKSWRNRNEKIIETIKLYSETTRKLIRRNDESYEYQKWIKQAPYPVRESWNVQQNPIRHHSLHFQVILWKMRF